jgi:hypothetical protein
MGFLGREPKSIITKPLGGGHTRDLGMKIALVVMMLLLAKSKSQ